MNWVVVHLLLNPVGMIPSQCHVVKGQILEVTTLSNPHSIVHV